MKITQIHKVVKSRLGVLARFAEVAYAHEINLARDLRDLESHLLAGILASVSTEFLRELAIRLHRPDGSPVPGFYERFVKGLRYFLCLDLVALFGTTADEAAPLLLCVASAGDADTVSSVKGVQLAWNRFGSAEMAVDGHGGGTRVFSVKAQRAAFSGPGTSTLPQSGRIVLLPGGYGVRAALLYEGDRPEWLPHTFSDDLIAEAGTTILLPQLCRLRMDELLAGRVAVFHEWTHEFAWYITSLSLLINSLDHIDRREHGADRERRKTEILARISTCLEGMKDLHGDVRARGIDLDARRNRRKEQRGRRDKRI